ncbi:MAG: hypothetical protein AB1402_05250 [Bacillota bacterium]
MFHGQYPGHLPNAPSAFLFTVQFAATRAFSSKQVRIGQNLFGAMIPSGRADILLGFEPAEMFPTRAPPAVFEAVSLLREWFAKKGLADKVDRANSGLMGNPGCVVEGLSGAAE